LLTEEQKSLITNRLASHINKEGILKIVSQEDRSQLMNKSNAIEKFYTLLEKAFVKKKKRIATKQSRASKLKRLQLKRIRSERKKTRGSVMKDTW